MTEVESTVIDNTELGLHVEDKKEGKKIVKYEIETQGDKECDACGDLEKDVKDNFIPNSEIPIEHKVVEADAKRKEEGVPYSNVCKIYEDGTKECVEILGGDKDDFKKALNIGEKEESESKDETDPSP